MAPCMAGRGSRCASPRPGIACTHAWVVIRCLGPGFTILALGPGWGPILLYSICVWADAGVDGWAWHVMRARNASMSAMSHSLLVTRTLRNTRAFTVCHNTVCRKS